MDTPTLTTERLILRRFIENDLEAICRIYSDEEANEFLPWFPVRSMAEARAFYQERLGMTYPYSYEEQWQPKNRRVIFRMYQSNLNGQKGRVYRKYWDNSDVRFVERDV